MIEQGYGRDKPYVSGVVELDEGVKISARIIGVDATKPEIRAAVEKMFEVEVEAVRVVNQKGKAKRFGARFGRRSDTRKAYVRLKEGQEIDFMPSA